MSCSCCLCKTAMHIKKFFQVKISKWLKINLGPLLGLFLGNTSISKLGAQARNKCHTRYFPLLILSTSYPSSPPRLFLSQYTVGLNHH